MMVRNKRAKGEGSVYLRKSDNRWCATLIISDPGQPIRKKTLTAKTEAGAGKLLTGMRRAKAAGELTTSIMTVETWMDYWFQNIALKKIRPKTAATYRSLIQTHILPVLGRTRLVNLTAEHVRKLEASITTPQGDRPALSSTTAMQAHRILATALKYAQREGKVTKNAAALTDAPRRARKELAVLTAADGVKILQTVAYDRLGSRWAAALLTGARQGELLGLELDRVTSDRLDITWQLQRLVWEHGCHNGECGRSRGADCPARKVTAPADWEHRYVTGGLWLSRPKSEAGIRRIPLVPPLRAAIEARVFAAQSEPNPHGLLWTADPTAHALAKGDTALSGAPLDPKYDNYAWHAILKRAGVTDARLHDARHTTASLLLKAGVPRELIPRILGHATYTQSVNYMDVDEDQLTDAMNRISSLMPRADTLALES